MLIVIFIILHFFFVLIPVTVNAQSSPRTHVSSGDAVSNFGGSLGIVVGVMSLMLALAFSLLCYLKMRGNVANTSLQVIPLNIRPGFPARSASELSGIDRTVLESLPFFRFASLKGSRKGLDCAVCLSRFEETDILRLLPKCKHAFHVACVDQWLEKHSSCPLCRNKINTEDISIFTYSDSMRILRNQSDLQEEDCFGSSRFTIEQLLAKDQESESESESGGSNGDDEDEKALLHKSSHKIIVSDVVYKHRWSNVSSSDLMFLNSEILEDMSDQNSFDFNSNDTNARKDDRISKMDSENSPSVSIPVLPSASDHHKAKRSMSDISAFSRFRDSRAKSIIGESSLHENNPKEAKMRSLWLPIARKTVLMFASREERPQQSKNSTKPIVSNV